MTLIAGIDVGNATTEVVIVDTTTGTARPVAHDRAPTRGRKGSDQALAGALSLLNRLERRSGFTSDVLAMAPQQPVDTTDTVVPADLPNTGRLLLLGAGRSSPAGHGVGVGVPRHVDAPPEVGRVVLVATDPLGFRDTVAAVKRWQEYGAEVVGVLLSGDEAVLVHRRIDLAVPVIDQINATLALSAELIAVEVATDSCRFLTDAVYLASALALGEREHEHAEAIARSARGSRDMAVALFAQAHQTKPATSHEPWARTSDGERLSIVQALAGLQSGRINRIVQCALPSLGNLVVADVDDLWGIDLTVLAEQSLARPGSIHDHVVALATLTAGAPPPTHLYDVVGARDSRPLVVAHSEATAARAGALSTPGASDDATVVDIGAGTIDVIGPDGTTHVLAGAGDLITVATASALNISRGQAEWAKRGPCRHVETPYITVDESGQRDFLEQPAATGSVGWLVAAGPAGPMPFTRHLAPSEWRTLRLRLKQAVLGRGIARGLAHTSGDIIVVGGPAGDGEVLDCLALAMPECVPGRGNVAGELGHRWAVAFGLAVLASETVRSET